MAKEKEKEDLEVINNLNKKFGAGTLMKLSEKPSDAPHISTGIIGLDSALGIGGLPYGRITEIYGDTGTGKSGITLSTIANAQREGKRCAIIDTEHALDPNYAALLGVNIDELFISQPDTGDDALSICEELVKSGMFGVVVIDSVAGLVPKRELDGDFGDANVGVMAKLMAQAMRKLSPTANRSNTCLIFTNQIRDNIGAFGYADTSVTTGGKSLKFFASVRIELKRMQQVKDGDNVVGHRVKATVKKNKLAAPFKVAEYEITYNQNAVKLNELVDLGVEYKFIDKAGAWFTLDGQRLQGKDKVRTYLTDNPKVAEGLEKQIRGFLGVLYEE